jgi:Fe-S oxidoreductase
MGGNFRVQHSTELLNELSLLSGGFSPNGQGVKGRVTYQDSCYLGRYNQIYKQPRQLLDGARVERLEMPRHGADSFCCGGGGGQMWLETDPNTRLNRRRLDDAQKAGAEMVATACPYCLLMFDDAIRSKGLTEQMQVMDIAEILERALIQAPSQPL